MRKQLHRWAFKPSMIADAPDTAGVYALWDGERLLHVGQAHGGEDTLRQRLVRHLEGSERGTDPRPTHYSWEICDPRERFPQLALQAFSEAASP